MRINRGGTSRSGQPDVSARQPGSGSVLAPERDPVTGRVGSGGRSNKDRTEARDHRPRARRFTNKQFAIGGASIAGVALIAGIAIVAAGGDESNDASPGVLTTVETVTTLPVAPTVVETTAAPTTVAPTTALATTTTLAEPVCSVTVLGGGATQQAPGETSASPIDDVAALRPNGDIATDATGFAEVAGTDGSLTRLDAATTSTCVGDGVMALTTGRSWNRTRELPLTVVTGDRSVILQPESAVAITCVTAPECTVVVLQGSASITGDDDVELIAPRSITLDDDPAVELASQSLVPYDSAFGDPWLADNASRDALVGLEDAAAIYSALGPSYGSLDGQFSGNRTVVEAACTGGPCDAGAAIGNVAPRTYVFDIDCATLPCVGQAIVQYGVGTEVRTATVPMRFDGANYTWSVTDVSYQCAWDDDGNGAFEVFLGDLALRIDYTLTASAAEVRDGRYVVTGVSVRASAVNTITTPHPRCAAFGPSTNASVFEATR